MILESTFNCALFDQIGQGAAVPDYFSVRVKCGLIPWEFKTAEQVRWLLEYPTPIFLACVDKKKLTVAIYHVMIRFLLRALGSAGSLVLVPEDAESANSLGGVGGQIGLYKLLAPIVKANAQDMMSEEKMEQLRGVFEKWVSFEGENCDLAQRGLLRFRIPLPYRVNEMPPSTIYEMGNATPPDQFVKDGILTLAEDAECLGGQFHRRDDRMGALLALMLVRHLRRKYDPLFDGEPRWQAGFPADLGMVVNPALNVAAGRPGGRAEFYGVDQLQVFLEQNQIVKKFLENK
jgi:hypothetical protein